MENDFSNLSLCLDYGLEMFMLVVELQLLSEYIIDNDIT